MTKYWSPKSEEAYKQYIEDIESSNDLKAKGQMQVVVADLTGERNVKRIRGQCACGNEICLEVGSFETALTETYVPCSKGTNAEGHGLWAQLIRIVQN